jgi:hypothetical protein
MTRRPWTLWRLLAPKRRNFQDAIKWEQKALSFPELAKNYGDQAQQRLNLYSQRKPYRER